MSMLYSYLWKAVLLAGAAAALYFLSERVGPIRAFVFYALFISFACGISAILLRSAPVGTMSWRNRPAGYFLTFGYRLTNGQLLPITVTSLALWLLAGGAAIVAFDFGEARLRFSIPLLAAWYIYAALIVRQIGLVLHEFRHSPRPRRAMLVLSLIMLGLVAGSAALWFLHQPRNAVALCAAPLLLIGGGYGLFLGIFLLAGRKGRWN